MKRILQNVAQLTGGILLLMLPAFGESLAAVAIGLVVSVGLLAAGKAFKFQKQ